MEVALLSCNDELNKDYPIRNSKEQKSCFRAYAIEQAERSGYDAQEEDSVCQQLKKAMGETVDKLTGAFVRMIDE